MFGRSHVKKVAEERIAPLNDYLASLIALGKLIQGCSRGWDQAEGWDQAGGWDQAEE